jgi:hypothetical protein
MGSKVGILETGPFKRKAALKRVTPADDFLLSYEGVVGCGVVMHGSRVPLVNHASRPAMMMSTR